MLLAIDIGNTNVTLGAFDGAVLRATWRMATDVHKMPDEYAVLLLNFLQGRDLDPSQIKDTIMCSSVPPLVTTFNELNQQYFGITPLVVGSGLKTGIRILYDNPREVGADRVTDAVAAYRLYGGPVIVVDCGTATVFDAISRDGDYLGGAIAPGIVIAAEALFERAARLPRIELMRPKQAIGRNTVASIQSGIIYGYVGLVEGLVARFQKEMGGGVRVVATGGLAEVIAREIPVIEIVNPNLTLEGLRFIHELNRP
ncbi:MAG: type III pantothenate kinase [Chloroflexi bacterium]|nr:type III pantothenate kinase [Chloroflexota bacterium]